jgi:hypothetical protein
MSKNISVLYKIVKRALQELGYLVTAFFFTSIGFLLLYLAIYAIIYMNNKF